MRDIKSTLASVRKRFLDNVSLRSNTTGGLGTATDGSTWTAVNGTINVTSGKATATAPAANASGDAYPIATVKMPTSNNIIEIKDTGQGAAAALWVQSSTDWWMVDIDSTFNTIPGNTTYGVVGSNYQTTGTNYGVVGDNYGIVGANYQVSGSNYVTVNANYGSVGSNYGATGSNYGASGSNYGATGSNYGATGTNYGATGSNYTTNYSSNGTSYSSNYNWRSAYTKTGTNYYLTVGYNSYTGYSSSTSASGSNYGATGSNYGATGTNYGATGTNYGANGTNYGAVGVNYGVSGSNYVTTGSNFTTVNSNYGDTGDNYGSVGSNYSTLNSNYGSTGTNADTYAYAQYLRIKQSSAGVVSTITSALISATQTINSLRIQLAGNEITAKAYSDPELVTQVGDDLVYTATGATITTSFGIAISPSEYQQSDIIGSSINITRA